MCCCSLSISERSSLTGLVLPCCRACWLAHAECILDIQLSCSIWVGACHNIINSKIYQYTNMFLTTFRYTMQIEQKSKQKNSAHATPIIPNFTRWWGFLVLTLRSSVYQIGLLHYSGLVNLLMVVQWENPLMPVNHGIFNTKSLYSIHITHATFIIQNKIYTIYIHPIHCQLSIFTGS